MRAKLKISFVTPGKGTSGSNRSIVRVGNELLSRGHKVRIFFKDRPPAMRDKIRETYLRMRYGAGRDWLLEFEGESTGYSKLNADMFASDELIIAMCTKTTIDMRRLPENVGIKVIYCRGVEIGNWSAMVESWKLPIPKVALGTRIAEMVRREVNEIVVGIAPNGVNENEFYPSLPESERNGIGAAFHWATTKSPETFRKTMYLLGKEMPEIPRCCYSNGRKPRGIKGVQFKRYPSVEEMREIYSSCRVWFHASISEGMPNPVFEAMACGCAVVSTDCGGVDDIIEDGVNGFIVGIGNFGALADRCMLLYRDEELRKQICENAMNTVQKFSWPKAAERLEPLLYKILDGVKNKNG